MTEPPPKWTPRLLQRSPPSRAVTLAMTWWSVTTYPRTHSRQTAAQTRSDRVDRRLSRRRSIGGKRRQKHLTPPGPPAVASRFRKRSAVPAGASLAKPRSDPHRPPRDDDVDRLARTGAANGRSSIASASAAPNRSPRKPAELAPPEGRGARTVFRRCKHRRLCGGADRRGNRAPAGASVRSASTVSILLIR